MAGQGQPGGIHGRMGAPASVAARPVEAPERAPGACRGSRALTRPVGGFRCGWHPWAGAGAPERLYGAPVASGGVSCVSVVRRLPGNTFKLYRMYRNYVLRYVTGYRRRTRGRGLGFRHALRATGSHITPYIHKLIYGYKVIKSMEIPVHFFLPACVQ
jgi:hypothetical protein